ncbi:MAG: MBL fold metallo-hydrolase [Chloroflexi bacterium]|nr:MBL fold metallo-hydrolase [Chloroflexota bacterium]
MLVHVGDDQWVVVDSCVDPSDGEPVALRYLSEIGTDVGHSVVLVVITHWHDDHVRGIRTVVEQCKAAKVAISAAFQRDEFLALPAMFGSRPLPETGVDEIAEVFRILQAQRRQPRFQHLIAATQDRLLLRTQLLIGGQQYLAQVHSLSPCDRAIFQACSAFGARHPVVGEQPRRITPPSRNEASVVLWVEVGGHKMLLGADLENAPLVGWSVLIENSVAVSGQAEVFKVSHHGAESGHEARIWSDLLAPNPFAVLCPWSLAGRVLPTASDSRRITALTPNAYITAPTVAQRRFRFRGNKVRQMVEGATKSIQEMGLDWGHVRLRRFINDTNDNWRVALFRGAGHL